MVRAGSSQEPAAGGVAAGGVAPGLRVCTAGGSGYRRVAMASLLIVDDTPDGVEALCTYLTRAGHTVECAPNGK
jgi:hypothetical protein